MLQRSKPYKNDIERCLTPIPGPNMPHSLASHNHLISFLCTLHNFSKQIEIYLNMYYTEKIINMALHFSFL